MTSAGAPPVIEARAVSKHVDRGRRAVLDGVSLAVAPGESLAVVGESGSGKTTLLNILSGLDRPSAGTVLFDGLVPSGPAHWRRLRARRIGIVFQNYCLLPTLSAAENVELPMLGVEPSAARRQARTRELLGRVGLAGLADNRPATLSGGERQRVAIARSLANRPAVVLADEPTGNLDRANADRIMDLLLELQRAAGLALVVVTHDPGVAGRCARRLTLAGGRIVAPEALADAGSVAAAAGAGR